MIVAYIALAFHLAATGIVVWFSWHTYSVYKQSTGTTWERLLAAARDSATLLWTRFQLFCIALGDVIAWIANTVGAAPGIDDQIKQHLSPFWMIGYMVVSLLIYEWARRRTLPKPQ